jgi:Glycosyl hydrolases family 16
VTEIECALLHSSDQAAHLATTASMILATPLPWHRTKQHTATSPCHHRQQRAAFSFVRSNLEDTDGATRETQLGPKLLALVGFLATALPALAHDDVKVAPIRLTLHIPQDTPAEHCLRVGSVDSVSFQSVSLHRTFNDDFDQHPLQSGRWVPHYAGRVIMPESFYAGGQASKPERKSSYNGEQEIYVDPGYEGQGSVPLGLDPFRVGDGILSIVASRTPAELKPLLFNAEYVSGMLTTERSFSQRYGYFEIRAKIPLGVGVWPAFWLLANDGGWPPEIDVVEGRGQRPGDVVMTTHWRSPTTGVVEHCGFDLSVPNAWMDFHNYGVLWERDRVVYFIDRRPVSEIKAPASFEAAMYMIVNLAMGSKDFGGVGFVDTRSPNKVEFQIDRISAYQIDSAATDTAAR